MNDLRNEKYSLFFQHFAELLILAVVVQISEFQYFDITKLSKYSSWMCGKVYEEMMFNILLPDIWFLMSRRHFITDFQREKMILLCVKFDSVKVTQDGAHKYEYIVIGPRKLTTLSQAVCQSLKILRFLS